MKKLINFLGIMTISLMMVFMFASCGGGGDGDGEMPEIAGMVWLAGGTFTMGSEDALDFSASPTHQVKVSGFYIGKYEVTQDEYYAVMGINPSYFNGSAGKLPETGEVQGKRPVENVTWFDAVEYCNKLSTAKGRTPVYTITNRVPADGYPITSATVTANWSNNGYRLPTEAEWEYACKAGTQNPYNPVWDGTTATTAPGWYYDNSMNSVAGERTTHEVGKKAANAYGLYDMHGNVYEWCWDWIDNYAAGVQSDPKGPENNSVDYGAYRVLRGGCLSNDAQYLRSAYRNYYFPDNRFRRIGFRVVCR